MHDALAYARDTYVVEVEDDHPAPRSRVPTEELTVHVYTLGKWHRRTPDLSHTGCGKPIHSGLCPVRREELVGDLCMGDAPDGKNACFTAYELGLAAANNRKDYEP